MSSSIRRRLFHVLDVVLRVPPIFIMDSIFVNSMKLPYFYDTFTSTIFSNSRVSIEGDKLNFSIFHSPLNKSSQSNSDSDDFFIVISNTSSIFLVAAYAIGNYKHSCITKTKLTFSFTLVFSISFCLFLLTTKHLIRVYKWLASVLIVILSYFLNDNYVRYIESRKNDSKFQEFSFTDGIFYTFVTNYMCQVIYIYIQNI